MRVYGVGVGAVDAAPGAHAGAVGGAVAGAHAAREAGAGVPVPAARAAGPARARSPPAAPFRPDAPPGKHLHHPVKSQHQKKVYIFFYQPTSQEGGGFHLALTSQN